MLGTSRAPEIVRRGWRWNYLFNSQAALQRGLAWRGVCHRACTKTTSTGATGSVLHRRLWRVEWKLLLATYGPGDPQGTHLPARSAAKRLLIGPALNMKLPVGSDLLLQYLSGSADLPGQGRLSAGVLQQRLDDAHASDNRRSSATRSTSVPGGDVPDAPLRPARRVFPGAARACLLLSRMSARPRNRFRPRQPGAA